VRFFYGGSAKSFFSSQKDHDHFFHMRTGAYRIVYETFVSDDVEGGLL